VLAGTTGIPKNIAAYFELIDDFRPEVVISDFESWTYLYAKATACRSSPSTTCRSSTAAPTPRVIAGTRPTFRSPRRS
jgi:hypothetical protein